MLHRNKKKSFYYHRSVRMRLYIPISWCTKKRIDVGVSQQNKLFKMKIYFLIHKGIRNIKLLNELYSMA